MKKLLHLLNKTEDAVCPLLLAGFILIVLVQLVGRVLGFAVAGVEELARTAFVYFAFFAAAYGVKRSAHARLTRHLQRLPVFWRNVCLTVGDGGWLFFNLTLLVKSVQVMTVLWAWPYTTTALNWHLGWVFAIFPVTFGLMTVRVVQNRVRHWQHAEFLEDFTESSTEQETAPWVTQPLHTEALPVNASRQETPWS